jgi:hypothetical protein
LVARLCARRLGCRFIELFFLFFFPSLEGGKDELDELNLSLSVSSAKYFRVEALQQA